MDEPGGEGGGDPKWGPLGRPGYPWAGRTVVVKDDAGHKTVIRSDSSGGVTRVEVTEASSTGPVAAGRESFARVTALGGDRRRKAWQRSGRPGGGRRQGLVVAVVAAVALVLVLGVLAALSVLKAPGVAGAPGSGVQVLSSNYLASPAGAAHACAPRSVLITWTLRGARPGALATVKVTGTGPTEQFNAPVGVDGKTVRVSISFRTPSRWNAEVIAVDGKLVRALATNPAGAITLAC